MAKFGVLHDYDLHANKEPSAQAQTCAVCGDSPMRFQWSDYHGEAMCCKCGCPYQLTAGSDQQVAEGKYPYIRLREDFIPVAKEYWEETAKFACYGIMMGGPKPGMTSFTNWLRLRHPEFLPKEEE
jgi:hypothetical protein